MVAEGALRGGEPVPGAFEVFEGFDGALEGGGDAQDAFGFVRVEGFASCEGAGGDAHGAEEVIAGCLGEELEAVEGGAFEAFGDGVADGGHGGDFREFVALVEVGDEDGIPEGVLSLEGDDPVPFFAEGGLEVFLRGSLREKVDGQILGGGWFAYFGDGCHLT